MKRFCMHVLLALPLFILNEGCLKKQTVETLPSVHSAHSGLHTETATLHHDYGDAVRDLSDLTPDADVFIISRNGLETRLARTAQTPNLALSFSTVPPSFPAATAARGPVVDSGSTGTNPEGGLRGQEADPETASVKAADDVKTYDPLCVLATVRFDLNRAELNPGERQKLTSKVIEPLKRVKNPILHVHGYTCRLGTKAYNDELAMERAKGTAAFLEANGIKPVMVIGEGKCCYVSEDPSENRRAVVTFINDKQLVDPKLCEHWDNFSSGEMKK